MNDFEKLLTIAARKHEIADILETSEKYEGCFVFTGRWAGVDRENYSLNELGNGTKEFVEEAEKAFLQANQQLILKDAARRMRESTGMSKE